MGKALKLEIEIGQFSLNELESWQQELIKKAEEAALKAYAPYSEFQVGAALLTHSGKVILGNNQENSAYPSGLCAERVAVFSAHAQYPNETYEAIAVTAKKLSDDHFISVTPCGSCRQVLSEMEDLQESPISLMMSGSDGEVYISNNIEDLLPFKFSKKYLK